MVFLYDGVYLPSSSVDKKAIRDRFSRQLFEDKSCEKCDSYMDRFSYLCSQCPAYLGNFVLYKEVLIKGVPHISIPRGAIAELGNFIDDDIEDKRKTPRLPRGLRINSDLWPHQKLAVRELLGTNCVWSKDKGTYVTKKLPDCNGIVKAPPRTGKTLIVLALTISFGLRTVILAHQGDLLNQFIEDIELHTNFKDIAEFNGKPVYGRCKSVEDFERHPIALATYQQLITEGGQKKLKKIRKLFGSVFIDESHRSAASSYSKVIATFPARNRIGVTGTVERKDGLDFITSDIVGKVLTSVYLETLTPIVYVHKTGVKPDRQYTMWTYAMQFLARHEKRTELIVKYVMRDLRNGRHILIPVTFVHQTETLAAKINEAYGENVAVAFHGKSNRKDIIEGARTGRYRVVVGIRSIVSTGINVPRWDCLHNVAPVSNKPIYTQELARCQSLFPGKPTPIIRHFVDDMGQSIGCFATCYFKNYIPQKFTIPQKTREKAGEILKNSKRRSINEDQYLVVKADLDTPILGGKRRTLFN